MKHLLIIAFICIGGSFSGWAQNVQVIFDVQTSEVKYLNDIKNAKPNELVTVRFENANVFLYEIEVEGKSISYHKEVPAALTALWGGSTVGDFGVVTFGIDSSRTLGNKEDSLSNLVEVAEEKFDLPNLQEAYEKLGYAKTLLSGLLRLAHSQATTAANIQDRKEVLVRGYLKRFYRHTETYGDDYEVLMEDALHSSLAAFEETKREFDEKEDLLLQADPDSTVLASLRQLKAAYNRLEEEVNAQDYPTVFKTILSLYGRMDESAFVTISQPILVDEDADHLRLDIRVTPRSTVAGLPALPGREFTLPLIVKGGWSFEFSSGLGVHNLADPTYTTKVDGDGAARIVKEATGDWRVSLMALAHARHRNTGSASLGFSTGVMLDTDTRLRYLLGGSAFLGGKNCFVLSAGLALGNIKRLSTVNSLGEVLPTGMEIRTIDHLQIGMFMGLSIDLNQ